jgi:hypothetical protein
MIKLASTAAALPWRARIFKLWMAVKAGRDSSWLM